MKNLSFSSRKPSKPPPHQTGRTIILRLIRKRANNLRGHALELVTDPRFTRGYLGVPERYSCSPHLRNRKH